MWAWDSQRNASQKKTVSSCIRRVGYKREELGGNMEAHVMSVSAILEGQVVDRVSYSIGLHILNA